MPVVKYICGYTILNMHLKKQNKIFRTIIYYILNMPVNIRRNI